MCYNVVNKIFIGVEQIDDGNDKIKLVQVVLFLKFFFGHNILNVVKDTTFTRHCIWYVINT